MEMTKASLCLKTANTVTVITVILISFLLFRRIIVTACHVSELKSSVV